MKTQTLFTIFIILNIAFNANAVFLKKQSKATFSVFNQLKNVENSTFGKKILDTIALQMKSKSPLGDIAKLLAEIRTDLATQQAEADQLHQAQEAECEEEINEYNRRIQVASKARDDAEAEITVLSGEIKQLEGEIKNKGIQLEILDRREVSLKEARVQDEADFKNRQENAVQVIGALELIIEKLQTIEANTNDESLVLAELNKLGASNPIMALVQVASTFSQESLDNVVQKMEDLRASIEASIEDDKKNEQEALAEYKALLAEITKTRKDVAQAKADAETKLKQTEAALKIQEKILEQAVAELLQANTDKAAKEQQCEEWRVKWAEDKKSRSEEIEIVKQVEAIIATKLDTMKDYLKDRANNE